jgi:hypothetical protein
MLAAGDAALHELINLCVQYKRNGGMGSFYRSKHELVLEGAGRKAREQALSEESPY